MFPFTFFRYLWGDHLIRAYQVLLYAPLARVRCFDALELPGRHGCGEGLKDDWQSIYRVVRDITCASIYA